MSTLLLRLPPFSPPGLEGRWPSWGNPARGSTFVTHTPPSAAAPGLALSPAPSAPSGPAQRVGLPAVRPASASRAGAATAGTVGAPFTSGRGWKRESTRLWPARGAGRGESGPGASGPGGRAAFPFALRPRKPLTPGGLARGPLPNPGLPLGGPLPHPTGRPGSTRTPTSRPDGQAEGAGRAGPRTLHTRVIGSFAPERLIYFRARGGAGRAGRGRRGGAAEPGSGGGAGPRGGEGPRGAGVGGREGPRGRRSGRRGGQPRRRGRALGAGEGRRGWGWGSCLRGEPGRPLVRPPPLPSPAPGRGGRSSSGSRMVSAAALQPRPVAPGPRPGPGAGRPPRPRTLT